MHLKCVPLPKLHTRVRFPSPAPRLSTKFANGFGSCQTIADLCRPILHISFSFTFDAVMGRLKGQCRSSEALEEACDGEGMQRHPSKVPPAITLIRPSGVS